MKRVEFLKMESWVPIAYRLDNQGVSYGGHCHHGVESGGDGRAEDSAHYHKHRHFSRNGYSCHRGSLDCSESSVFCTKYKNCCVVVSTSPKMLKIWKPGVPEIGLSQPDLHRGSSPSAIGIGHSLLYQCSSLEESVVKIVKETVEELYETRLGPHVCYTAVMVGLMSRLFKSWSRCGELHRDSPPRSSLLARLIRNIPSTGVHMSCLGKRESR